MPPQMILDISARRAAPCPVPHAGDTDRGFARTFLSVVSSLDSAGGAVASLDATAVSFFIMVGLVVVSGNGCSVDRDLGLENLWQSKARFWVRWRCEEE